MINISELATGVHVNYLEHPQVGSELSAILPVSGRVVEIVDDNSVQLEVNEKRILASKEQIYPIPLSKELLVSLGFKEEFNLFIKIMNPQTPIKKYLLINLANPEYPLSLFEDNSKGMNHTSRIEVKYPAFHFVEQYWHKESDGFTIQPLI